MNDKSSLVLKTNTINDEYDLQGSNILGQGVSGSVIKCYKRSDKTRYAVKAILNTPAGENEIQLHWLASRNSPFIVRLVEVFDNTNIAINAKYFLMIMECMDGGELFSRIKARGKNLFTEREAAGIVKNIACAINHIHSLEIAHRDIKPENLLYSSRHEDSVLKLTDFGFAKLISGPKQLQTPCYTHYYVAPEVLLGSKYDKSCDIWSLGVVTYILLSGKPPFFSRDEGYTMSPGMKLRIIAGKFSYPEKDWTHISSEAKSVINALLCVNPKERPTIQDVFRMNWIKKNAEMPLTPLSSPETLSNSDDSWNDMQVEIKEELEFLRNKADCSKLEGNKKITLKNIDVCNSRLITARNRRKGDAKLREGLIACNLSDGKKCGGGGGGGGDCAEGGEFKVPPDVSTLNLCAKKQRPLPQTQPQQQHGASTNTSNAENCAPSK